jgi:hypothetical protein
MIKESILFVASTGLLIYFISPSDEPAEPEPVEEQVQETVAPAAQSPDNAWDYDDEEADEGEDMFVFGEPMTDPHAEDYEDEPVDEEAISNRQEQSASRQVNPAPAVSDRQAASENSPRSGEKGSADNPIILKTNNPPDPEDD